ANSSGSPPLKVFDLRTCEPQWVTSDLSEDFMDRSPEMEARLKSRYRKILPSSLGFVDNVATSASAKYIMASGATSRWRRQGAPGALMKFSLDGELLCAANGLNVGCIAVRTDGRLLAVSSGGDIVLLNADGLSVVRKKSICSSDII